MTQVSILLLKSNSSTTIHVFIFFRFKDEAKGETIIAACCLRSKLYALLFKCLKEILKMKGMPASAVKRNQIRYRTYRDCLNGKIRKKSMFYRILAKSNVVKKYLQEKASLVSAFDDKRWIYPCGIHSLAFGNRLAKKNSLCPHCK